MMAYSFDKIIDRRGTDSVKHDFAEKKGKPADILPLWVADMDFASPPGVLKALEDKVRHGVFGYSDSVGEEYYKALAGWYSRRFGFYVRPEWLIKTPGVVFTICAAIRALSQDGDAVIIQQPVYYPFESGIKNNGRKPVVNELVYMDGRYSVDLLDFENKIIENRVKIFLLCSPHNPVGRVWREEELLAMGEICERHGVFVISDEIHADFVYPGYRHWVFSMLKPSFNDFSIICTAPSKTFNLPGLQIANIFIPNADIRNKVRREILKTGYSQPNLMGLAACRAAYETGEEWLTELKAYLLGNIAFMKAFLSENIPKIRLVEPEGTYLVWLDCRDLGLSDRELDDILVHKARLWLDAGPIFGAGGNGFQRINIACPREVLREALVRMKEALAESAGK